MQTPAQPDGKSRVLSVAFAAVLLHAAALAANELPRFNVFLEQPGVYWISYEDVAEALAGARPATASLGLSGGGEPVPIWVADGGDGTFDPGDWLEFVGEHVAGDKAYLNEYTRSNVYVLDFAAREPARMHRLEQRSIPSNERVTGGWFGWRHFERDRLLLRFIPRPDRDPELWYWSKLTQLDRSRSSSSCRRVST